MMKNSQDERFKISLYENGVHSLRQGLEAYQAFARGGEPIQLKDAIMGIHHGVELLLKEMLVRHNQFLIFEDLRNVAKKQKHADRMGLGIFFIENPPRTVSFNEAVSRVEAFLQPATLDESLTRLLEDLNQKRNQLEHYTIDADIEEIDQLIADIKDPLLALFNSEFGEIPELSEKSVEEIWQEAKVRSGEAKELQVRARSLMDRFSGQRVPGRLFSLEGMIELPAFESIQSDYRIPEWPMQRFDLFGVTSDQNWAVEVRARIGTGRSGAQLVQDLSNFAGIASSQPWLVLGTRASDQLRQVASEARVYLTDERDLEELEGIIDQTRLF